VEAFYTDQGYLLPPFHKAYWIGLNSSSWPSFRWLDGLPAPSSSGYVHWGTTVPDGIKEPNNASPKRNEMCAAANYSQAFDSPMAWGWADQPCATQLPFMCKEQPLGSAYAYVSPNSLATYVLNTSRLPFVEAQATCNAQGGHLVYYDSLAEQSEVEAAFVSRGAFIPSYHKFYWIGYRTLDWPNFVWVNNDSRADNVVSKYSHWGTYYVGGWGAVQSTCLLLGAADWRILARVAFTGHYMPVRFRSLTSLASPTTLGATSSVWGLTPPCRRPTASTAGVMRTATSTPPSSARSCVSSV
jgi:hypothetical protein